MTQITTHVLDAVSGHPAKEMEIRLSRLENREWTTIGSARTNHEGRCVDLCPEGESLAEGSYRMHFLTATYFLNNNHPVFYPYIDIVFNIGTDDQHYHIPLLLSPFGYSTYRGS